MNDQVLPHVASPPKPPALVDFVVPATVCALLIVFLVVTDTYMAHWLLLPVLACGILTGPDAIRWIRGAIDLFDVRGIIGILSLNFFFFAPLLHIYGRADIEYAATPSDWRPWIGAMATINLVGIIIYLYLSRLPSGWQSRAKGSMRVIVPSRVIVVLPIFLGASVAALAYYILARGGVTALYEMGTREERYAGTGFLGMIMTLGYATPVLAVMFLTFLRVIVRGSRKSNILVVGLLFLLFAPLPFLAGGASGSRSSVMFILFWAGAMFHFFWRRFSRKWLPVVLITGVLFMYCWHIFKRARLRGEGTKVIAQMLTGESIRDLAARWEVRVEAVVLGAFSRADIQALLLYRLNEQGSQYRYRYGLTYLTGPLTYIPRMIWPSKPFVTQRVEAGTEAQMGSASAAYKKHGERGMAAVRVYGLAGEAMLNFNFYGVPVMFALWGYVVRRCRRLLYLTVEGDARLAIIPFWVLLCVLMLASDSDNLVALGVVKGMFPLLAWWLVTTKVRVGRLTQNVPAQSGGRPRDAVRSG